MLRAWSAGLLSALVVSVSCVGGVTAEAEERDERAAAPSAVSPGDQRYGVAATFDAERRRLTGIETVSFTNTGASPMMSVFLRLWPNGQTTCGKPFVVVDRVTGGTAGAPTVGCTELPIRLAAPIPPGGTGELSFRFRDTVPENWNFRYGVSGDAVFLGNAFPILALTDEMGTHHEPYALAGESTYSSVAAWDVTLTVPRGVQAATTGAVTSRTSLSGGRTELRIEAPIERDFAMAIGRFRVSSTTAQGIRIRYFAQPSSRVPDADVLRWAREAVDSFTDHYGPYDQPEIDLVGGIWGVNGFEYPSLLMTVPNRDIVIHEVAHLWWYSMVGNNQWAAPWTDESFAEFSTRRLKGTIAACDPDHPFAGVGGDVPLDADMGTFEAEGHYVGTVYVGGPCVLERLRGDWGDARFDAFMAGLVADHRGGFVDTCTVIGAIHAAAPPGYDIDDFLETARLASADC